MMYYKIRNEIKKTFNRIKIDDKGEAVKESNELTENKKLHNKRKPQYYKKVICFAATVAVIAAAVIIGLIIKQNNQNNQKTKEENDTEISITDIITIKHEYNPIMSSSIGIGILFEFTYDGGIIELMTDRGFFCTWDIERGRGPVTDVGTMYTVNGDGYIFWSPSTPSDTDTATIRVTIMAKGNVVGLASIKTSYNEDRGIFAAEIEKTVDISVADGNYQKIDQDVIDNFFGE